MSYCIGNVLARGGGYFDAPMKNALDSMKCTKKIIYDIGLQTKNFFIKDIILSLNSFRSFGLCPGSFLHAGNKNQPTRPAVVISKKICNDSRNGQWGLYVPETFGFWYVKLLSNHTWSTLDNFPKRTSDFMKGRY